MILHPDIRRYLGFLDDTFGLGESVFADYTFFFRNERLLHIVAKDHLHFPTVERHNRGLKFMHIYGKVPKLTTAAVTLFGKQAKKNVIHLNKGNWDNFRERREFLLPDSQTVQLTNCGGQAIAWYSEFAVGLAQVAPIEHAGATGKRDNGGKGGEQPRWLVKSISRWPE